MTLTWKSSPEKEVLAHFEQALRSVPRLSVGAIQERVPLGADHVTYEVDAEASRIAARSVAFLRRAMNEAIFSRVAATSAGGAELGDPVR